MPTLLIDVLSDINFFMVLLESHRLHDAVLYFENSGFILTFDRSNQISVLLYPQNLFTVLCSLMRDLSRKIYPQEKELLGSYDSDVVSVYSQLGVVEENLWSDCLEVLVKTVGNCNNLEELGILCASRSSSKVAFSQII